MDLLRRTHNIPRRKQEMRHGRPRGRDCVSGAAHAASDTWCFMRVEFQTVNFFYIKKNFVSPA